MNVNPDPWIMCVKGSPRSTFEISVLRKSNTSGIASYGWFGDNKLLVSSSGGPCHDVVMPMVWKKLLRLAEEVADELNASEGLISTSVD